MARQAPPLARRIVMALAATVPFGLLVTIASVDGSVEPVQAIVTWLLAFVLGAYGTLTYTAGMTTRRNLREEFGVRFLSEEGARAAEQPCPDCGESHAITDVRVGFKGVPHPDGGAVVSHLDPDVEPPCHWNAHAETQGVAREKVTEHLLTECPRRSVLEDLLEN